MTARAYGLVRGRAQVAGRPHPRERATATGPTTPSGGADTPAGSVTNSSRRARVATDAPSRPGAVDEPVDPPQEQPRVGQPHSTRPERLAPTGAGAGGRCAPDAVVGEQILFTAEQAGVALAVPGSWLRDKAAAGQIPCRRLGKHLRFARADLDDIAAAAAQPAQHPLAPPRSPPPPPSPPPQTRSAANPSSFSASSVSASPALATSQPTESTPLSPRRARRPRQHRAA